VSHTTIEQHIAVTVTGEPRARARLSQKLPATQNPIKLERITMDGSVYGDRTVGQLEQAIAKFKQEIVFLEDVRDIMKSGDLCRFDNRDHKTGGPNG